MRDSLLPGSRSGRTAGHSRKVTYLRRGTHRMARISLDFRTECRNHNRATKNSAVNNLSDKAVELYLDELHSRYLAGDNFQLLAAMRFCAGNNREMPRWVVDAFQRATDKWYSLQSKTLDEALGVAWPGGKDLQAARKRRREQITVYNKVVELVAGGRAIDDELLAEVGAKFRLSSPEVADYYYTVKRFFEPESVVSALSDLMECGEEVEQRKSEDSAR